MPRLKTEAQILAIIRKSIKPFLKNEVEHINTAIALAHITGIIAYEIGGHRNVGTVIDVVRHGAFEAEVNEAFEDGEFQGRVQ
jgi:hypothetical protein